MTRAGGFPMRKRSDLNQQAVIDALRKNGVGVVCLSTLGNVPDLLCGLPDGRNVLLEVKNRAGHKGLTPAEEKFMATWQGECHVVYTPEQALKELGLKMNEHI